MILRPALCIFLLFTLSTVVGLAAEQKLKVRAFALKEGTFADKAQPGSSRGVDVLADIQKQFNIDLSKVPGAQAVFLPKDRSLVVRAPEETIRSMRARMSNVIDRSRPAASGTPAVMQARLDAIMIPEVKFNVASSEAVAAYIRQAAEPYGIAVQLLAKSDPESSPTVTLALRHVPLSAILKFYTSLTNMQHRVQADDVVVEY